MFGGEELFKQGVVEVQDCSGTGYGFCGFNYRHRKGFTLSVRSMGEDYAVDGYSVHCGHSQMPIRQLSGPDVKYP